MHTLLNSAFLLIPLRLEHEYGLGVQEFSLDAAGAILVVSSSQAQFQTLHALWVVPGNGVVVIWSPNRPNSNFLSSTVVCD